MARVYALFLRRQALQSAQLAQGILSAYQANVDRYGEAQLAQEDGEVEIGRCLLSGRSARPVLHVSMMKRKDPSQFTHPHVGRIGHFELKTGLPSGG
jgi:hypothetical protein